MIESLQVSENHLINNKMSLRSVSIIMGLYLFALTAYSQSVPFPSSGYTLEAVRLRSQPSTAGSIIKVLPAFTNFEITEQLHQEKIGNETDHWYKVRMFDESQAVGYLFGHFLSVRQKGRQVVTLKFTEVQIGDYFHLRIFS